MTDEKTALNGTTITTTILDQNLKKKKKGYTPLICATDDSDNEEDISEITSLTCGSSSSSTSKERKKEKIRELGIGPIANGDNIQQEKTCMVSSKQHASTPQHIRAQNNTGMVPPQQEQIKVPLELQNYNGMPTKKDKAAAYSLHIDGKRTRKPRKFFVAESSGAHNITNNNDNDNDSTFINSSKRKRKASVLKKLNSDHVNTKDTKNSRIALLRLHRQSNIEVRKGLQFRQNFTHTTTYTGKVISKESQEIWNAEENEDLPHWTVEFDDGEIIDILESELKKRVQETATEDLKEMGDEGEDSQDHNNRTYIGDPSAVEDYEIIKQDLIRRATYSEEEVVTALDTMTVPYCLNTAVKKIMDARDDKDTSHSLLPLGRKLYAVEVFCGCAIVSNEFVHRKWRVRALDNDPNSRATHQVDFMNFTWASIMNVPDFIWLSPPCFTYSKLAGGKHRDCNNENYSKTPEARDHDRMLWRILWMLKFMIKKKPHMIIMIENPEGSLSKMPIMERVEEELNLCRAKVNYCTLGRSDKKPTHLWTNDHRLAAALNFYQFGPKKCQYHDKKHPAGARDNKDFNAAAIPKFLAEIVAAYVDGAFALGICPKSIRRTEEPKLSQDEIDEFNKEMSDDFENEVEDDMVIRFDLVSYEVIRR